MIYLQFLGLVILGLIGIEIFSYLVHRFLFHGLLWKIHKSHHEKSHGKFELNDLFSLGFALVAMILIVRGIPEGTRSIGLPVGVGITLYGVLYFIIHDLYTHRRFFPFKSSSRLMQFVKGAHQRHHQSVNKPGHEPYGLFLFDYEAFKKSPETQKQRVEKAAD